MKTPFSKAYIPPAPVLNVALALRAESPKIHDVTAFVDTGADTTMVPTAMIEKLDAPYQYSTRMRAFVSDSLRPVSIHRLDILIDGIRYPAIDVIADDVGNEIILGRNFLNKLRLLLDGPKSIVEF